MGLTQAVFEAGGRVDDDIEEAAESRSALVWRHTEQQSGLRLHG